MKKLHGEFTKNQTIFILFKRSLFFDGLLNIPKCPNTGPTQTVGNPGGRP